MSTDEGQRRVALHANGSVPHARDHQEWCGEGADETDALVALWTRMHDDAPPEALSYAAAAITRRTVAMSIVGHKTESIYRRYAIVDEAMQREAAARLDAWIAAPPAAPSTATVTVLRRGSRLRGRAAG